MSCTTGATVSHLQAGRALGNFAHILEMLACVESTTHVCWDTLAEALIPEAPRLTAVVAILMDWTPERAACIGQLRALGVGGRIIVIRRGAPTLSVSGLPPEEIVHLRPGETFPSAGEVTSSPMERTAS